MREDTEARMRRLVEAGDMRAAATEMLEVYGPELLGWLVATLRDRAEAEEVFSMTSEDLWRGLSSFRWDASARTWLYTLARHAASRRRRAPHERAGRRRPLSELSDVEQAVRTRTRPWLRTDVKDAFTALRDALDEDDRSLLVLRVDRRMTWEEIARVLGGDEAARPEGLKRVAARMRKRFQLLRDELRERARAAGLLDET